MMSEVNLEGGVQPALVIRMLMREIATACVAFADAFHCGRRACRLVTAEGRLSKTNTINGTTHAPAFYERASQGHGPYDRPLFGVLLYSLRSELDACFVR